MISCRFKLLTSKRNTPNNFLNYSNQNRCLDNRSLHWSLARSLTTRHLLSCRGLHAEQINKILSLLSDRIYIKMLIDARISLSSAGDRDLISELNVWAINGCRLVISHGSWSTAGENINKHILWVWAREWSSTSVRTLCRFPSAKWNVVEHQKAFGSIRFCYIVAYNGRSMLLKDRSINAQRSDHFSFGRHLRSIRFYTMQAPLEGIS